jgi:transposase
LRLVPDESGQQPLVQRLRAVIAAKDEQIAVLAAQVGAVLEREHRLELRVAEMERRLSMDSSDSGTPSSKEGIGAKAARKAGEKKGRQESERERSKGRKRGGQPGHQGKSLARDPDPDQEETAEPLALPAVRVAVPPEYS